MSDAVGAHRLVALVTNVRAGRALLFDVGHFAVAAYIPVSSGDAAASHRREPEQSNETHRNPSSRAIAIGVPCCSSFHRDVRLAFFAENPRGRAQSKVGQSVPAVSDLPPCWIYDAKDLEPPRLERDLRLQRSFKGR